jgi:hypothetical protein
VIQNYPDHDPSPAARDYRCGSLTYDGHDGTDFRLLTTKAMHAGVAVLAAAGGRVSRVRDGMPDLGLGADRGPMRGRECGNGVIIDHRDGWETQYCHMAQGSIRVSPGAEIAAGHALGRIGLSGKTEFPHLHLTVRHQGHAIDPFALGASADVCGSGASLWTPALARLLVYRAGLVLNFGFSTEALTMDSVEQGKSQTPDPDAPALVAFVRAIGLLAGDVPRITLRGPSGDVLADSAAAPLDRAKAQHMMFAGKRRTTPRWPGGVYRATYTVTRDASVAIDKTFEMRF